MEPIRGCGEGDERLLLENFGAVARVFAQLPKTSRDVIQDVTQKMGDGMADYVSAELAQGTVDVDAYNLYCHNVAGLVGEGLTGIFVGREYESRSIEAGGDLQWPFCSANNHLGLANSMGLFLQKTNIIRDYLEDYVRSRRFEVLRCLHFLGWTRIHLTMTWVLSLSILRPFDAPRRWTAGRSGLDRFG